MNCVETASLLQCNYEKQAQVHRSAPQLLPCMKLAPEPGSRTGLSRDSSGSGFTLVEVMVATVLLSMIILGILAVLIGSYRVAAKARYNDHARYVVKSFADQFLTQQSSDTNGTILPLFTISKDRKSTRLNSS